PTSRSRSSCNCASRQTFRQEKAWVPAHRVVNSQGLLTGKHHFVPPSAMEERLKKEGVKVVKDKVVDFGKVFWDPMKEL
ncbi:MAG TPA: hypothetical protein VF473_08750, partial [Cyclobacteriaceae bacterium]